MATRQQIWRRLQNARDEMMEQAGLEPERMGDLDPSDSGAVPRKTRVRVSEASRLRAFGGLVGHVTYTGDGRPPSKRGWIVVDFESGVIGDRQHFPFRREELLVDDQPEELVATAEPRSDKEASVVIVPDLPRGLVPFVPARPDAAETARRNPFSVDPEVIDRGNHAHQELLFQLSELAAEQGLATCRVSGGPDLDLAWTTERGDLTLIEVKSITVANESRQIRLGLGQLLDYAHSVRLLGHAIAGLVLAVEYEPSNPRFVDLCETHGVKLVWPEVFSVAIVAN